MPALTSRPLDRPDHAAGRRLLRDLLRAASWHRRLLAAGLAAAATAAGLTALAPPPPATRTILVAARDLSGGATLHPGDVQLRRVPAGSVPRGALTAVASAAGRVTAAPVAAGEPVTSLRLVGPGLVAALRPGLVAAPVRIADAGAVGLLHAGDLVDVVAASGTGGAPTAQVVAARVRVIAVPDAPQAGGFGGDWGANTADEALVVLATTLPVATDLARASVATRLSVVIRPA